MKTETQSECHARLKCKADEELEECKKRRARAIKEGRDPNKEDPADKDRGDRDDADKKDRDRDADKKDRDRDADKKDRDRDAGKRDRDRDAGKRDRDPKVDNSKGRGGGKDDDAEARQRARDRDGDDHGGGVLRPGTRPGFFSGGIGPSWAFCYRANCGPGALNYLSFYGSLDFGWHFSGSFKGPAIGANIHGGVGSFGPYDHSRFGVGFKFWWDIQPSDSLGLYITPFAQAGFSSFIYKNRVGCDPLLFDCNHDWEHFFNLQVGAQLRMVLGNRGLLYFQPITFDNVINGGGYGLLYHFEVGGGVIFGG